MLSFILVLLICLYEFIWYRKPTTPSSIYICSLTDDKTHLNLPPCNLLFSKKQPFLQTSLGFLLRKISSKDEFLLEYNHIATKQGNPDIWFWWHNPSHKGRPATKLAICVLGLSGDRDSHYVRQFARFCINNMYICCVLDKKEADIASTEELKGLVLELSRSHDDISIVGVSAGGNVVARYAAFDFPPKSVKACVSLCNGYDLNVVRRTMGVWAYVCKDEFKQSMRFSGKGCCTVWDVLDGINCIKKEEVNEFYDKRGTLDVIGHVTTVPLVLVNSKDDPFFSNVVLDMVKDEIIRTQNKNVTLIVTESGGHVGWMKDLKGGSWLFDDALPAILEKKRRTCLYP